MYIKIYTFRLKGKYIFCRVLNCFVETKTGNQCKFVLLNNKTNSSRGELAVSTQYSTGDKDNNCFPACKTKLLPQSKVQVLNKTAVVQVHLVSNINVESKLNFMSFVSRNKKRLPRLGFH